MATAKEEITELLQQLPDDSSYDEIVRQLALHVMIERGLKDSDEEQTISNDEMRARINTWLKSTGPMNQRSR
jgi:hypothetical protein